MKLRFIKAEKATVGGWKFHIPTRIKHSLLDAHTEIMKWYAMEKCPIDGGEPTKG